MYTESHYDDVLQAYAAGLVEGHLTKEMIQLSLLNQGDGLCKEPVTGFCKKLKDYMNVNLQWMYSEIAKGAGKDPYWHQVYRDHCGYGHSQWEEALLCNAFSHWLSSTQNDSLVYIYVYRWIWV